MAVHVICPSKGDEGATYVLHKDMIVNVDMGDEVDGAYSNKDVLEDDAYQHLSTFQ
jgi:hypothetical protein